jgi:hypothetical protein
MAVGKCTTGLWPESKHYKKREDMWDRHMKMYAVCVCDRESKPEEREKIAVHAGRAANGYGV